MDDCIDIKALLREARVPVDDPGAVRLVQLVAEACASLCDRAEPAGDAEHVPEGHVVAVGAELGAQIRAVFQID